MVRPLKYGESTDWSSYRIPAALDRFVKARAAALGVTKSEALILVLLDVQAEGPAALRSVQHKQEAVEARRQLVTMARDINALAARETAHRKKARDLSLAYRTLAGAVNVRSDKLRESIRARLASLDDK